MEEEDTLENVKSDKLRCAREMSAEAIRTKSSLLANFWNGDSDGCTCRRMERVVGEDVVECSNDCIDVECCKPVRESPLMATCVPSCWYGSVSE